MQKGKSMKVQSIGKYLKNPDQLLVKLSAQRRLDWMSDKQLTKLLYRTKFHRKLDLDNPKSLNEKIHWIKLFVRDPLYTRLTDKYAVRKYIAEIIGSQYSVPLLGVWDHFEEIDFNQLPNQFVLKCNHDSGSYLICKDKSTFDIAAAKAKLESCLSRNHYRLSREWAYINIKPLILAEEFLTDHNERNVVDYKFLCFHGEPKCVKVCTDRGSPTGVKIDFFDMQWNHLPFIEKYPNANRVIERPKSFDEMVRICRILSEPFPFVRMDLYGIDERIYFGEFTFYPGAGMEEFTPDEWDYTLGSWLTLPSSKQD